MSEMRLTTLNLDKDCLEILRSERNKSKYARECIKRYHVLEDELDRMENSQIANAYGLRALARFLVSEFNNGDDYLLALMANWCEMTELELSSLGVYAVESIIAHSVAAGKA